MKKMLLLVTVAMAAFVVSCGNEPGTPTPEPTSTPAPNFPTLELTAELTPARIRVGETFVVSTDAAKSGLAQYRLNIDGSSHSSLAYDGTILFLESDRRFRLEEWNAVPDPAAWTFTALERGEFQLNLFVTGEVSVTPNGPFVFTHGERNFTLIVDPAS